MAYAAKLFDVTGQVCIVTGASSGLGRHMAKMLAGCGAKVVVAARRQPLLDELVEEISREGGTAFAVTFDARSKASLQQLVDATVAKWGTVDVLINNAGVALSGGGRPSETTTEEEWDSVQDTNLKATFFLSCMVAEVMVSQKKGGSIVNIASIMGLRVDEWSAAYASSKAGVVHLTKALALEWATLGVRVNALCPGFFRTDINAEMFGEAPVDDAGPKVTGFGPAVGVSLHKLQRAAGKSTVSRIPMKRVGRNEELDGAVLLLCSRNANSFLTGVDLPVDGGHLCSKL